MIVVTGAAGFIGSCMVSKLNNKGFKDIIMVDDFSRQDKSGNTLHKKYHQKIERELFIEWFKRNAADVSFVIHLGARTDTTEFNRAVFDELNLNYSKRIWEICSATRIPLIYASSAATYGDGSLGYSDLEPGLPFNLKPLNPYGESKNDFDKWVLSSGEGPPHWFGVKFFNVFGPNEYHKGRMASVVFHAFRQIKYPKPDAGSADRDQAGRTGRVRLFRSHNPQYPDGGQLRDFIYVKDVADVLHYLMENRPASGLYNLGTGHARTFLDLANAVYSSLNLSPDIEFVDTPLDIRDKYQYFTQADMKKLRAAGYRKPFYTLENAIEEYVQGYLLDGTCF